MKKERWRLYAKKADFAAISKAYGINQVTARIMRNRGVETKEEIESYLKGDLDYLSDMFNWNYGAYKSSSNAINSVSDSEIKDMLNKASNIFQGNISKILNILNRGGNNE